MKKFAHGCALVVLCLALAAANAAAQAWEITPFARYVTNAEFDFVSTLPGFENTKALADHPVAFGAGVKKMASDTVGFRLQAAYAPSYPTESNDGYWCDPFYGCYTVPDPQYLDQWEFSLGIVKRLGSTYRQADDPLQPQTARSPSGGRAAALPMLGSVVGLSRAHDPASAA